MAREFKVAVVMGSSSDEPYMKGAIEELKRQKIPYEVHILSAHRNPEETREFARSARSQGISLIIAGAGYAAHLPGFLASFSDLPVLGVPIPSSELKGIDSLLSIFQMPSGLPVAGFGLGAAGARNAAAFAARLKTIL